MLPLDIGFYVRDCILDHVTLSQISMETHKGHYIEDSSLTRGSSPLPCEFGGVLFFSDCIMKNPPDARTLLGILRVPRLAVAPLPAEHHGAAPAAAAGVESLGQMAVSINWGSFLWVCL